MIEASCPPQALGGLTQRLEARARQLGERRAAQIASAIGTQGHRWRSASALWPGFSQEQG